MKQRFKASVAVFAIVRKDEKILMILRAKTGMMDGYWSLPAGGVDGGEIASDAAIRELREETSLIVEPDDVKLVHTQHNFTHGDEWMGLYFEAGLTAGRPYVAEPHKHGAVEWFDIGDLPGNTVPYVRQALANILAGGTFSSFDDGGVL
ncbi:8-oxo-dGTP pyrophosphatase MutT (NUDIX family) [Luteibacter sp. 1214]|uniref:NUDIX hydrolase n=1 Tax=Luteibacter sp. 1214 TaxID=2817735 RepID=UPI00285A59EF|nr:NUDIX domain-containing protein [Luteibacter sp. 1214]MDR6642420.1 8-oxo-dGTP pyrophosphatase MutT (NUDIX family) [Luteibacter sp. 1214]